MLTNCARIVLFGKLIGAICPFFHKFALIKSFGLMTHPYLHINLGGIRDFFQSARVGAMGDCLSLGDNLDEGVQWVLPSDPNPTIFSPMKFSSVVILFICLEGEVVTYRNLRDYQIRKNDVTLVKSGVFGKLKSFGKDVRFVGLAMQEELLFPMFNDFDMSVFHEKIVTNPVCSLSEGLIRECVSLYKLIKERLRDHAEDNLQEKIIKGYLQTLISIVYSQYDKMVVSKKGIWDSFTRQQDYFNRFMDLLQENYTRERNVAFYAKRLCVTPRYLSRVIRSVSGHFANEHIDIFVIEEAKQLLRSKQFTVLQVSEMLSFTNPSFFTRYFKRHTGFSPTDYQST